MMGMTLCFERFETKESKRSERVELPRWGPAPVTLDQ